MSPAQGAMGGGAHSALCSRRTRNPSFQGPICPGPLVPQSALALSCVVHVRVRRGSCYTAVRRYEWQLPSYLLPGEIQRPFPARPWPARPCTDCSSGGLPAHGHGQREENTQVAHTHTTPTQILSLLLLQHSRTLRVSALLPFATAAAVAAPDRRTDKTTRHRLRHDPSSRP